MSSQLITYASVFLNGQDDQSIFESVIIFRCVCVAVPGFFFCHRLDPWFQKASIVSQRLHPMSASSETHTHLHYATPTVTSTTHTLCARFHSYGLPSSVTRLCFNTWVFWAWAITPGILCLHGCIIPWTHTGMCTLVQSGCCTTRSANSLLTNWKVQCWAMKGVAHIFQ